MRIAVRLAIAVLCALAALQASPALAERRVALSVGVNVYDSLPAAEQLKKAVNDARAVGAALKELGFDTAVEENVTRLAFIQAWQRFLNRLEPGDTAALFFAGHGVEVGGLNYLLPRDVPQVVAGQEKVLAGASLRLNELMEDLRERKVRVSLFIVDACRDNPFRDRAGRSVGGSRGLTRVEAAKGSFVMYSAGEGEEALDRLPGGDADPNSVFTRALLPILKMPGLSLQEIAVGVREKVVATAQGAGREQTPAYYDRLVGKLVLKAKGSDLAGLTSGHPVLPPMPAAPADMAWAAVKDSDDTSALETFRQHYGKQRPVYDRLAALRIDALTRQRLTLLKAEEDKKRDPALAVKPGSGASFRDRMADGAPCPECPEMVVAPAGSFMMGSPAGEEGRYAEEGPQRRVTVGSFAVGKFEVTFAEWDACLAAGGCTHRPGDNGWGRGKQPVINVSWDDTNQYLWWLSRKTGKMYRLLTEAEWEYVARAGTSTPFWWGTSISPSQANYDGTYTSGGGPKGEFRAKTLPVDSFAPNPWGLYNVHGNVWEWTQDCWNGSYNGAPSDGSAWTTGDCSRRVVRGGSWDDTLPGDLRAAFRYGVTTSFPYLNSGFRLARTS